MPSDRGSSAHDPDVGAKCMLHCLFARIGGSLHSRQYIGSRAVPVKHHAKMIAVRHRMIKIL
eukprot:5494992-Pyramimonas_sp.AAC.1